MLSSINLLTYGSCSDGLPRPLGLGDVFYCGTQYDSDVANVHVFDSLSIEGNVQTIINHEVLFNFFDSAG